MKKVVYTLALEGYPDEMTDLTFPWIKKYAEKIEAEFQVISQRKFPDWPPTAEKCQIYELGQNNDWSIFVDADAVLNPELFDVTSVVYKDTVLFTGKDMAAMRFRPNKYALRDGRYLGACTWFVVCSDWTIDLWRPLDVSFEEAVANIFPTNAERLCRIGDGSKPITPDKLIEDYICSQNIARFGLKHTTIEVDMAGMNMSVKQKYGRMDQFYWHPGLAPMGLYWHQYTKGIDEKILEAVKIMMAWGMITPEIEEKYHKIIERIRRMPPPQQPRQMMMGPG